MEGNAKKKQLQQQKRIEVVETTRIPLKRK
jgi:hypothetical protein